LKKTNNIRQQEEKHEVRVCLCVCLFVCLQMMVKRRATSEQDNNKRRHTYTFKKLFRKKK